MQASSEQFISTEDLASMLDNKTPVCILNASTAMAPTDPDMFVNHNQSHIPTSSYLDLKLVRDSSSPYNYMMPTTEQFRQFARALGISKSTPVVVYEIGKGWWASRAAFMLKTMGHPNVRILDGGFAKWTKEARATETTEYKDDDFSYERAEAETCDYDAVMKALSEGAQVVDARPPPAFQGGNMPGSVNLPAPACLQEDGTMKSAADLQQLFAERNISLDKPMVFSCGAGIMATLAAEAARKAGASAPIQIYDASFQEFAAKKQA